MLKIYGKNPNFKSKPPIQKWCNYCRRYVNNIAEGRQKPKKKRIIETTKTKRTKQFFYQYIKKDQVYQTKTFKVRIAHKNHFQIAIAIADNDLPIKMVFAKDHQSSKKITKYI